LLFTSSFFLFIVHDAFLILIVGLCLIKKPAMDSFALASDAFLDWFKQHNGSTRVNDKIQIADLRAQGAGRAVGELWNSCLVDIF
jgi:hypothetical protein